MLEALFVCTRLTEESVYFLSLEELLDRRTKKHNSFLKTTNPIRMLLAYFTFLARNVADVLATCWPNMAMLADYAKNSMLLQHATRGKRLL
jgi:hypothetical protein